MALPCCCCCCCCCDCRVLISTGVEEGAPVLSASASVRWGWACEMSMPGVGVEVVVVSTCASSAPRDEAIAAVARCRQCHGSCVYVVCYARPTSRKVAIDICSGKLATLLPLSSRQRDKSDNANVESSDAVGGDGMSFQVSPARARLESPLDPGAEPSPFNKRDRLLWQLSNCAIQYERAPLTLSSIKCLFATRGQLTSY